MWNFLKYWIWKQWNSNQDTKCCHCKVVLLSCPRFGLLHSAQIQIFFPMKEAIVTTPYSAYKHKFWRLSINWNKKKWISNKTWRYSKKSRERTLVVRILNTTFFNLWNLLRSGFPENLKWLKKFFIGYWFLPLSS